MLLSMHIDMSVGIFPLMNTTEIFMHKNALIFGKWQGALHPKQPWHHLGLGI